MSTEIIHSFGLQLWHVYLLVIFVGFLQGFINTMAGAGTTVMFSFLSFFGMPVNMINGTVRPGILFQTAASSFKYYKKNKLALRKGLVLGIPMIIGSVFGAEVAISIDGNVFEKIVAVFLLILMFPMFYNPKKWLEGQSVERQSKTGVLQLLIFTFIGFYGGFLHIGVGIILLVALVLNVGYDLVQANALKVFLVLMYAPIVLIIFLINGQVDLLVALFVTIGNIVGGIVGANVVIKKGSKFVRMFLVVIIIVFSFHLLGVWKWAYQLVF
ncbi:MAG: sulfite exporter TauE/SafE family protein [Bacteroidales bacterium]|nr:sulfite exporter TauE/SafE family protein [Bacteroidales bacterium]MDY0142553.1 sulfite exporter TauE/SafE family protein [Bacteroidales bacterium]